MGSNYNNLKKYLDTQIGDHGYVRITKRDGSLLCEGKVSDLRANRMWVLIAEDERRIYRAYTGKSENGERNCIIIELSNW